MSVVLLRRGLPIDSRLGRSIGMADVIIDLERAIDGIRALRSDLESYYWERAARAQDSQGFQISLWIRQLSDRGAALESIVMHKASMRLRVRDVSADEAKALETSLLELEQWVYEEDPFAGVLEVVAAALAAADRVGLRAAGGSPEG
jgi:hypothetical protein